MRIWLSVKEQEEVDRVEAELVAATNFEQQTAEENLD